MRVQNVHIDLPDVMLDVLSFLGDNIGLLDQSIVELVYCM